MFYITNLELKNYIQFSKRGVKLVTLDFTTGINIFNAPNGYGKSTIMKELNPFNRNGNDSLTIEGDGYKKITYGKVEDSSYKLEIYHIYTQNKTGYTIKTKVLETIDGETVELNPSNNNKSGEDVISSVLGITKNSLKATGIGIKYGRSIFNFLEADDRQKYNFVKDILNLGVYSNYEKIVGTKFRDTKRDVDSLRKSLKPLTADYDTVINNLEHRLSVVKETKTEEDNLIKKLSEELTNAYGELKGLSNETDIEDYNKMCIVFKDLGLDYDVLVDKMVEDSKVLDRIKNDHDKLNRDIGSIDIDILNIEKDLEGDTKLSELKETYEQLKDLTLDDTIEVIDRNIAEGNKLQDESDKIASIFMTSFKYLSFPDIKGKTIGMIEELIEKYKQNIINMEKDVEIYHNKNFNNRVVSLFSHINNRSVEYDTILDKLSDDISKASSIDIDELNGTIEETREIILYEYMILLSKVKEHGVYEFSSSELKEQSNLILNEYESKKVLYGRIQTREAIVDNIRSLENSDKLLSSYKEKRTELHKGMEILRNEKQEYSYMPTIRHYLDKVKLLNERGINSVKKLSLYIIEEQKHIISINEKINRINESLLTSKNSDLDDELNNLNEVRNETIANRKYRDNLNDKLILQISSMTILENIFKTIRDEIPMIVMRDFLTDIRLSTNAFIGDNHSFKIHDISIDNGTYYEFKCTIINDSILMEAVDLSSGEQSILLLSMLTAFMKHLSKDYMILRLDEADATLDTTYRSKYIDILIAKSIDIGQTFIITHNKQYLHRRDEMNIIKL